MREQKWGRFINMTSTSGLIGNVGQANYAAAKLGIFGLTKVTALDMARYNVTANCISPFAWTRMIGTIPTETEAQKARVEKVKQMSPAHIAPMAAFLASDAAKDITGQVFGVRGKEIMLFGHERPIMRVHQADGSLAVGGRVWVTSGYGTHSISLSELRWRGVDSVVSEVNLDVVWNRFVVMGSMGGGGISQGVLIDEDFNNRDHDARTSRTRSDVDDTGLFYVNADLGFRALRWGAREQPGFIDALGGYQYWHETYVAFGATSAFPAAVPTISSTAKVITQDYYWHSLRLGGRAQVPLFGGLSLKARAFLLPWSYSILDDVHHRRGDFRQDPSLHGEAAGGLGVQADAGLTFRVWRGLSVEVGYQYWRGESGVGREA